MTNGPPRPAAGSEFRELARWHGLELSEADARDLQPFYDQQQCWLAVLRQVLGDEVEPATAFSAAGTGYVRE